MKVQVAFEHARGRVDPAVRAHRRSRQGPFPADDPQIHDARPMPKGSRQVRGQGRDHRHRDLARSAGGSCSTRSCSRSRPPSTRSPTPGSPATTSTASPRIPGGDAAAVACRRAASPRWRTRCGSARRGSTAASRRPDRAARSSTAMLAVAGGPRAGTCCASAPCGRRPTPRATAALERRARQRERDRAHRRSPIGGDMQWRLPYGASSAANWIAMQASAHFDRYGTTREIARVDRAERPQERGAEPVGHLPGPAHDGRLPLGARMITTPFGLFDCDVPVRRFGRGHRARARTLAADLRAAARPRRGGRHPDHRDACRGTRARSTTSRWSPGPPPTSGPAPTSRPPTSTWRSSTTASRSTACRGSRRSGSAAWARRRTSSTAGRTSRATVCSRSTPTAGSSPSGRLHGYGFIHEAVTQLRGDAGERQVANAETAVVSTGGGTPGGCFLFTVAR